MMYRALLAKPGGGVHFYCSSGGNAGLACATAAATLGQACTIVVPTLTSAYMIDKIRRKCSPSSIAIQANRVLKALNPLTSLMTVLAKQRTRPKLHLPLSQNP